MAEFCSCDNLKCTLHPNNHDKGCTPCIRKNLKTKEMPTCFFNLLDNPDEHEGDSLRDFAELVLKRQA